MVQWLGLCAFTALDQVQFLVRKLRSPKPCSGAKKKRKKENEWMREGGKKTTNAGIFANFCSGC